MVKTAFPVSLCCPHSFADKQNSMSQGAFLNWKKHPKQIGQEFLSSAAEHMFAEVMEQVEKLMASSKIKMHIYSCVFCCFLWMCTSSCPAVLRWNLLIDSLCP